MATIVAAPTTPFRERIRERLLEAGCEGLTTVESLTALEEALRALSLREHEEHIVFTGGNWPAPRPFLHAAVRAGVPTVMLLNLPTPRTEQAALAEGARAALDLNTDPAALTAALAAVHAGLIVSDRPLSRTVRALDAVSLDAEGATLDLIRRPSRSLTPREREILSLVAGGTSNKGIARALAVSTNTVKFHIAAAFEKLDVTTRAEAVAEAIRRGELSL